MAQPKPERERIPFEQLISLVQQLTPAERERLRRRLELQAGREQWANVKEMLAAQHAVQGLPSPTDEEIHDEIELHSTAVETERLQQALAAAEASIEQGEGIPGDVMLNELRQRADERLRKSQQ
jgi:hypothetical protein